MRRSALRLALLVALAGLPAEARGQGVALYGGDVDLTIPAAPGGFGTASDETTRLVWEPHPNHQTKVTVETLAAPQRYQLTVEALAPHRSVSTGPVVLQAGALPQDLVIDIKKARGRPNRDPGDARLRYEASIPPGPIPSEGVDVHTVTYTITAQ